LELDAALCTADKRATDVHMGSRRHRQGGIPPPSERTKTDKHDMLYLNKLTMQTLTNGAWVLGLSYSGPHAAQ